MHRLFALFLALLPLHPATAQEIAIDGPGALATALRGNLVGATLMLAPGDYGRLVIRGSDHPAVIRSADPADPAVIRAIEANGFDGLRLEGLHLDYEFSIGDPLNLRPFSFSDGQGLELIGNTIEGDRARQMDAASDGYPTAFGLSVRDSRDITITGNRIFGFYRGSVISQSQEITVLSNDYTGIRMDGMNFAEVVDVLIENNHIHDFDRSLNSNDHADFIQFWTNQTETPSRNIIIRSNVLNSGGGAYTQSIFMRNDLVDRGISGPEMFYRDILIEDNVIINAHLHGITVGETRGLTIRGNTVVQNIRSAGEDPARPLWIPQIRTAEISAEVRIEGNIAAAIIGHAGQPGWRVSGNLILGPADYAGAFLGTDSRAVASFRYRPDGPADQPGLGAEMLSP